MRVGFTVAAVLVATGALSEGRAGQDRQGRITRVEHVRPDMAHVPGGTFLMGPSDEDILVLQAACRDEIGGDDDYCELLIILPDALLAQLDSREVHVDAFQIDRFEVTVAEYRRCVIDGACDVAPLVNGDERYLRSEWPMVHVTWYESRDYCAWAGKRLPTEAEWEKAARGTDGRRWPWGNHDRVDGSNHGSGQSWALRRLRNAPGVGVPDFRPDDADGQAHVVAPGTMRWSEGPYGTYDMAGNVSEWTADYFSRDGRTDLSPINPVREVPSARDDSRVARGGSWAEPRFFGMTWLPDPMAMYIGVNRSDYRSPTRGFRCARDP
jgi:formylglycine-generating enzyme required for sulfatase activity